MQPTEPHPLASLRHLISMALMSILLLGASPLKAAPDITIVLSNTAPIYQTYAQAFRAAVNKHNHNTEVAITILNEIGLHPISDSGILVAVGSDAAEELSLHGTHQPLFMTMLPRENLIRISSQHPKTGGIYVDQPAARYIALVRAAFPDAERIGMMVGKDSGVTITQLQSAARGQKLHTQVESISKESDIFPALQRILSYDNILLATPDASIFNAQTIPNILLSAYRHNVPLIGFSPDYVKAGAVIALYSTPEQLAAQSVEICLQILSGAAMPGPQAPKQYTIGINSRVAASLGLDMGSETTIRERIEHQERQP
jgi:putative tryptophan/tyrosine transport system substrate-binding protein